MVGERFRAEVIAGQEQLPAAVVPDRECEVAEQVVDTVFTPLAVGVEEQPAVAELGGGAIEPECTDEFPGLSSRTSATITFPVTGSTSGITSPTDSGVVCSAP